MAYVDNLIIKILERIATALERIADNLDILVEKKSLIGISDKVETHKEPINIEKLLTEKGVHWETSLTDLSRRVISRIPLTQDEQEVLIRMWKASGYMGVVEFNISDPINKW